MAFTLKVITGNYFDAISGIKWNYKGGTLNGRYNVYTIAETNKLFGASVDIKYTDDDTESLIIYFTLNNNQKTLWQQVVSLKSGYFSNSSATKTDLNGTVGNANGQIILPAAMVKSLTGTYTVDLSELYGLENIYHTYTKTATVNVTTNGKSSIKNGLKLSSILNTSGGWTNSLSSINVVAQTTALFSKIMNVSTGETAEPILSLNRTCTYSDIFTLGANEDTDLSEMISDADTNTDDLVFTIEEPPATYTYYEYFGIKKTYLQTNHPSTISIGDNSFSYKGVNNSNFIYRRHIEKSSTIPETLDGYFGSSCTFTPTDTDFTVTSSDYYIDTTALTLNAYVSSSSSNPTLTTVFDFVKQYYKYTINMSDIQHQHVTNQTLEGTINGATVKFTNESNTYVYRSKTLIEKSSTASEIDKLFDEDSTTKWTIDTSKITADRGYEPQNITVNDFGAGNTSIYTYTTNASGSAVVHQYTISVPTGISAAYTNNITISTNNSSFTTTTGTDGSGNVLIYLSNITGNAIEEDVVVNVEVEAKIYYQLNNNNEIVENSSTNVSFTENESEEGQSNSNAYGNYYSVKGALEGTTVSKIQYYFFLKLENHAAISPANYLNDDEVGYYLCYNTSDKSIQNTLKDESGNLYLRICQEVSEAISIPSEIKLQSRNLTLRYRDSDETDHITSTSIYFSGDNVNNPFDYLVTTCVTNNSELPTNINNIIRIPVWQKYEFIAPSPFPVTIHSDTTTIHSSCEPCIDTNLYKFTAYVDEAVKANSKEANSYIANTDFVFQISDTIYSTNNTISKNNNSNLATLAGIENYNSPYDSGNSVRSWDELVFGITQTPELVISDSYKDTFNYNASKVLSNYSYVWSYTVEEGFKLNLTYTDGTNSSSTSYALYSDNSIDTYLSARRILAEYIYQSIVTSTDYYHFKSKAAVADADNTNAISDYLKGFTENHVLSDMMEQGIYYVDITALPNTINIVYDYNQIGEFNFSVVDQTTFDYTGKNQSIHFDSRVKTTEDNLPYAYYTENVRITVLGGSNIEDRDNAEKTISYFKPESFENPKTASDINNIYNVDENRANYIYIDNQAFIDSNGTNPFYDGISYYKITISADLFYLAAIKVLLESCNPDAYRLFTFDSKTNNYKIPLYCVKDNVTHIPVLTATLTDDGISLVDGTFTDKDNNHIANNDTSITIADSQYPDSYAKAYFTSESISSTVNSYSPKYILAFTRKEYEVTIDYNYLSDSFYIAGDTTRDMYWANRDFSHYPNFEKSFDNSTNKVTLTIKAGLPIVNTIDTTRHSTNSTYYDINGKTKSSTKYNPFYYLPNKKFVHGTQFSTVIVGDSTNNTYPFGNIGGYGAKNDGTSEQTIFCLQGHGRIFDKWVNITNSDNPVDFNFNTDGTYYVEGNLNLKAEVTYPTYYAYLYYTLSDMIENADSEGNNSQKYVADDDTADVTLASKKIAFTFENGITFPSSKSISGYSTEDAIYYDEDFLKKVESLNGLNLSEINFGENHDGKYTENTVDFTFFEKCIPLSYTITVYDGQNNASTISALNDVNITLPTANENFVLNQNGYTFAGWINIADYVGDSIINETTKYVHMYNTAEIQQYKIYMTGQSYKNLYSYNEESGVCTGFTLIPVYMCANLTANFNFNNGLAISKDNTYSENIQTDYQFDYAKGSLTTSCLDTANSIATLTYKPGYKIEKDSAGHIIWYKYDNVADTYSDTTITSANISNLTIQDSNSSWRVKWVPLTYTVYYHNDNATFTTEVETYDTSFAIYSDERKNPTKAYHSFIGWGTKDSTSSELTFKYQKGLYVKNLVTMNDSTEGEIHLYAIFVPNIAHIDGVPFKDGDYYFDMKDKLILKCKKETNNPQVTWEYAGIISNTN